MQGSRHDGSRMLVARTVALVLGIGVMSAAGLVSGLGGCATVEDTFTPGPKVARPVEAVYRFENVRRVSGLDEWSQIRRILESHARGSVTSSFTNQRAYDSADIRDYEARLVLRDVDDMRQIQKELDDLGKKSVGGEKIRFTLKRAEVAYRSEELGPTQDTIVRGVAFPAGTVKLFLAGGDIAETQANQYGAWAKSVKVKSGEPFVYGYKEGGVNAPAVRRYFRIDVLSMREEELNEEQFNARPR
jgi:hypothetical protein